MQGSSCSDQDCLSLLCLLFRCAGWLLRAAWVIPSQPIRMWGRPLVKAKDSWWRTHLSPCSRGTCQVSTQLVSSVLEDKSRSSYYNIHTNVMNSICGSATAERIKLPETDQVLLCIDKQMKSADVFSRTPWMWPDGLQVEIKTLTGTVQHSVKYISLMLNSLAPLRINTGNRETTCLVPGQSTVQKITSEAVTETNRRDKTWWSIWCLLALC